VVEYVSGVSLPIDLPLEDVAEDLFIYPRKVDAVSSFVVVTHVSSFRPPPSLEECCGAYFQTATKDCLLKCGVAVRSCWAIPIKSQCSYN
jgi:hypothetical protein